MVVLLVLTGCGQAESLGPDQHGVPIAESALVGQWLVINYWAVWCAPCRKEIPELNTLHHAQYAQGIRVLGVNYDQLQGAELLVDSQQLGIAFPVLSRDPALRFALPAVRGLPVTYIVNPQGQLVSQLHGEQSMQSILQALADAGWSAP
jgi:thiol-disulfide isomerase/thioredoxin